MFPLGGVLLPGGVLPLRVFEPRYLALVRQCQANEVPEFGVVLIERGNEVGGGDVRHSVGTAALIAHVETDPRGHLRLITLGTRRIRVRSWLPEDPFPNADVEDWPEDAGDGGAVAALLAELTPRVRRAAALSVELGDRIGSGEHEIVDDPVLASHNLVELAPLGPADRYELLCASGPMGRLELLAAKLGDIEAVLEFRLHTG